jgi:hypothetical protein
VRNLANGLRCRAPFAAVAFAAAVLCVPTVLVAQQSARLTGYLEHQFSANYYSNSGWQQIDYDRLRLDLNARAGLGTRVSAAVVYQLYRGNTTIALADVLPQELAALVDTASVTLETLHYLNHAYVTIRPGPVELTAGKQYLTWGAAAVFNPTELFRPKNILEPGYEREGIGAVSAKLPLGQLSDVRVAWVPEGGFDTSGKLLRVRHHIAGFDLSALVAEVYEQTIPTAIFGTTGVLARRRTIGGDVTGELLGLGVWTEATWSDLEGERWVEVTAGGNYTLEDGTRLMLEGYYNGRGESDAPYSPASWLSRLSGNSRTLGERILVGNVTRPFGQLWQVGFSALGNVGDKSAVLIPSVAYSFAENVDLMFNGQLHLGEDGTEFGAGNYGGFLRGRVYF